MPTKRVRLRAGTDMERDYLLSLVPTNALRSFVLLMGTPAVALCIGVTSSA